MKKLLATLAVVGVGCLPTPQGTTEEGWAALRRCESGGNHRAVSKSGKYRGAYQFDMRTWRSVGGVGDPADAPLIVQTYYAHILYEDRGSRPWPRCGRHL